MVGFVANLGSFLCVWCSETIAIFFGFYLFSVFRYWDSGVVGGERARAIGFGGVFVLYMCICGNDCCSSS